MSELQPIRQTAGQWLMPVPPDHQAAFNHRELVAALRRRWLIIAAIMAVIITGGMLWLSMQVARYSAEAAIMLDSRKVVLRDIPNVLSGVSLDFPLVRGEVQVLQSWPLAARVVENLNIASHPEYAGIGVRRSMLQQLGLDQFIPLGLFGMAPKPVARPTTEQIVGTFMRNLAVITDGRSYVIRVRFSSTDPALAAAVANEVARVYISEQIETKAVTLQKLNAWLIERTDELREKARMADLAVRRFRAENNLAEFKGTPVNQQQISDLSAQLIVAGSERAQKEARLRQVQQVAKTEEAGNIYEVLSSPLIQRLREQEAQVLRREAELNTRYGEKHPSIINVRAEVADLKQKISAEVQKIIQGIAAEADIARVREATLRSNLEVLKRQASAANPAEGRLAELEREAETSRKVLDAFLTRVKESSGQENFQGADVKIISTAQVPTSPTAPQRGMIMGITVGIAMVFGIGVAFLIDRLDDGVRSIEQLERRLGISCLGMVPKIGALRRLTSRLADIALSQRHSSFAEAVRSVRAALSISLPMGTPKVVLVTSPSGQEGKSLFALSLARSAALDGRKVLLIDCNLRNPAVADLLQAPSSNGLDSLIQTPTSQVKPIRVDGASGLHYIPTDPMKEKAHEALGSPVLRLLIEEARRRYEMIILDAPGLAEVSDSVLLLPHADAILVAVQWHKTSLRLIERAMRKLMYGHGRLLGLVITRVDGSTFARYLKGQDVA